MRGFEKMNEEELNITLKSFRNAYIYIFIFLFIWVVNDGNDSMAFFLFISQGVVLSISHLYYKKKS
ncbi:MAG: hypothetical protein ACRDA5_14020 [Clostridium sp.]